MMDIKEPFEKNRAGRANAEKTRVVGYSQLAARSGCIHCFFLTNIPSNAFKYFCSIFSPILIFEKNGAINIDKKKILDLMTEQHKSGKIAVYEQMELPLQGVNEKAEFYLVEEDKEEQIIKTLLK